MGFPWLCAYSLGFLLYRYDHTSSDSIPRSLQNIDESVPASKLVRLSVSLCNSIAFMLLLTLRCVGGECNLCIRGKSHAPSVLYLKVLLDVLHHIIIQVDGSNTETS